MHNMRNSLSKILHNTKNKIFYPTVFFLFFNNLFENNKIVKVLFRGAFQNLAK